MMIMTYYEIKKVFSKKGSKVALIFIFIVISVVLSFIIGDNKYVNRNGDAESGISAMLKVRELKKEWSGELTEDVLRKIIEENINKGLRKFETAKELNKSQSTIGKEIKNNRKRRYSQAEDVPRKSLGEKTPYEAFEFFYGKEPLEKFNIQKIKEDEVTLQPYLLNL